jgi:hypothetical protein
VRFCFDVKPIGVTPKPEEGMRRRDFMTRVGAVTAAWPLEARAQQPMIRVIGFLNPTSPEVVTEPMRSFRQGLLGAAALLCWSIHTTLRPNPR